MSWVWMPLRGGLNQKVCEGIDYNIHLATTQFVTTRGIFQHIVDNLRSIEGINDNSYCGGEVRASRYGVNSSASSKSRNILGMSYYHQHNRMVQVAVKTLDGSYSQYSGQSISSHFMIPSHGGYNVL